MRRIKHLAPIILAALFLHTPLLGGAYEEHGLSPAAVIIGDHSYGTFRQVTGAEQEENLLAVGDGRR